MKLVSVRLEDIRRFTSPVIVSGFEPGLNVLCAPNENGKSTLFDALQACFFQSYRSRHRDVKSLRPNAGGSPSVTLEIELGGGAADGTGTGTGTGTTYRIVKRWLSKPMAEVWQGSRLVAKSDDAEAWIARLGHAGGDGSEKPDGGKSDAKSAPDGGAHSGPAGLLWVRQGVTGLEHGTARERDAAQGARRDLLSSFTHEIDAVTAGRGMETVLTRCDEELAQYQTASGRARTGGPLKSAEDEVEHLTTRHAELASRAARLQDDLEARRRLKRELTDLTAPEAVRTRQDRLTQAQQDLDQAERHAGKLDRAADQLNLARLRLDTATDRHEALRRAGAEAKAAGAAVTQAEGAITLARDACTTAEAAHTDAQTRARSAEDAAAEAETLLHRALRAEAAATGASRRADLVARLANAETLRPDLDQAAAEASAGPDARTLQSLETQAQEVAHLRRSLEGAAPDITMQHLPEGAGGVTLDGAPLPEGAAHPIPRGAVLKLRGLGTLTIRPGRAVDDGTALRTAEKALAQALSALGLKDMAAARTAARARDAAAARLADLRLALAAEAPRGVDVLRQELAALPKDEGAEASDDTPGENAPPSPAPSPAQAQQDLGRAVASRDAARATLEHARHAAETARTALIRAESGADSARARLDRAREALTTGPQAAGPDADPNAPTYEALAIAAETTLRQQIATLTAQHDAAHRAHAELHADAPDLEAARAALTRARSVCDSAEREVAEKTARMAGLDSAIDLRSGEGVEEELADTADLLRAATESRDRIRFEVEVLTTLAAALRRARAAARDRTFAPVMAELRPLLHLLWPDAKIEFDDRVLPTHLTRDGQIEELDVLSGGTREQIALLVRLAFARMLATSGRHAPVILDDALVFTDDDRIETMFNALHRQAGDLQIIVLSCRQRAFRDLGGRSLSFQPAPEAD